MKVKCKFVVTEVTTYEYGHQKIQLKARYDDSEQEDVNFAKETPSGSMEFLVTNGEVINYFQPGKTVYITLEQDA